MRCKFAVVSLSPACSPDGAVAPAPAQTHFDLAGTVTDNSGAVVPGVTVTLRNLDTGLVRTSVTDERRQVQLSDRAADRQLDADRGAERVSDGARAKGSQFQANTLPQIDLQLGVAGLQEIADGHRRRADGAHARERTVGDSRSGDADRSAGGRRPRLHVAARRPPEKSCSRRRHLARRSGAAHRELTSPTACR